MDEVRTGGKCWGRLLEGVEGTARFSKWSVCRRKVACHTVVDAMDAG